MAPAAADRPRARRQDDVPRLRSHRACRLPIWPRTTEEGIAVEGACVTVVERFRLASY